MTIEEAIADTYLKATGKVAVLTTGTKFNKIVGLLNFYQRRWAREPNVNWNSLYTEAFSIGSVTATDTFDLDISAIRNISNREGDTVKIAWTNDSSYTEYDLVPADSLKSHYFQTKTNSSGHYASRIGNTLVFNHTFVSTDSEFGGEIFVPVYAFPDPITATNLDEDVQVDDPDWLILRAAAEYVRTDLTRQGQYPNLLAEANEAMQRMIDDNESQVNKINMPWTPGIASDTDWL